MKLCPTLSLLLLSNMSDAGDDAADEESAAAAALDLQTPFDVGKCMPPSEKKAKITKGSDKKSVDPDVLAEDLVKLKKLQILLFI